MDDKKRKNYFIFALFATVILLAIGYAAFAEALNIAGTAQTTGTFDVEFFDTSVTVQTNATATSVISGDKNSLTINVDLQKPGSTSRINVVVKNVGNINAKLLGVDVTGNNDADIVVNYPTFDTNTILASGNTYSFDIDVTWALSSTTGNKNVEFTATLNYQQEV